MQMMARQTQQTNKWQDRAEGKWKQGSSSQSPGGPHEAGVTGSRMSDGSPSLLFSVGGSSRLTSKQMKELLNQPDDKIDQDMMYNAIWGLLDQARHLQGKTKDDNLHAFESTNRSMAFQSEIDQVTFKRSALIQEQEVLRAEILQLNSRLSKLEEIKTSLENTGGKSSPRKRGVPTINQKTKSIDQITQELLELGVVKKLTSGEKVGINDEAVSHYHTELVTLQKKNIDEMSKYDLLQLKKPKYTLLMDRISR